MRKIILLAAVAVIAATAAVYRGRDVARRDYMGDVDLPAQGRADP